MVVSGVTVGAHVHEWVHKNTADCCVACKFCGEEPSVLDSMQELERLRVEVVRLRTTARAVEERVGRALILLRGP